MPETKTNIAEIYASWSIPPESIAKINKKAQELCDSIVEGVELALKNISIKP